VVVRRGRAYDQRLRRPVATASTGIAPADLDGVVTAAIPGRYTRRSQRYAYREEVGNGRVVTGGQHLFESIAFWR